MERAAKKKDSLAMVVIASMIVWVSACLLSSAASASSATPTLTTTAPTATHVALKSRAEVFLGVSLKNVERSELSPVNATRYYDVLEGVVLECLVAPVKGLASEPNRIYSARELIRRGAEPGPFHNFPESFNSAIFKQGTQTRVPNFYNQAKTGLSTDSIQYRLPGVVNGREGFYEIFTRPSLSGRTEVIIHRFFNPTK